MISRLKLDPDAKFLSQQEETLKAAEEFKREIQAYRRAQEPVELKEVK